MIWLVIQHVSYNDIVAFQVPAEEYPQTPVNECEIDDDCFNHPFKKCCDSTYVGIRKCVLPIFPSNSNLQILLKQWN